MRRINYFTKFIKLIFCKKCLYNFKSIKMVLSVSFFLQDFLKYLNFPLLLDFSTFYNVEQSSSDLIGWYYSPNLKKIREITADRIFQKRLDYPPSEKNGVASAFYYSSPFPRFERMRNGKVVYFAFD